MTPVIQTKVVVRNSNGEMIVNGNCYAAAIASMLDLPITEVPNVEVFFRWSEENRFWDEWMNKWLALKGWEIVNADEYRAFHEIVDFSDEGEKARQRLGDDYYLGSGPSVRGVNHICIYQAGELVHDPHPTNEGLKQILWFEKLVKINTN